MMQSSRPRNSDSLPIDARKFVESRSSVRGALVPPQGMFPRGDSDGRFDIFDMAEHENGVGVLFLETLKEEKGFLVVGKTAL